MKHLLTILLFIAVQAHGQTGDKAVRDGNGLPSGHSIPKPGDNQIIIWKLSCYDIEEICRQEWEPVGRALYGNMYKSGFEVIITTSALNPQEPFNPHPIKFGGPLWKGLNEFWKNVAHRHGFSITYNNSNHPDIIKYPY